MNNTKKTKVSKVYASTSKRLLSVAAEHIVERYYQSKGHRVLQAKYRCKLGGMDLVTEKEGIYYLIKVRSHKCINEEEYSDYVNHETKVEYLSRETGSVIGNGRDLRTIRDGSVVTQETLVPVHFVDKLKGIACFYSIRRKIDLNLIRIHIANVRVLINKVNKGDIGFAVKKCRVKITPI